MVYLIEDHFQKFYYCSYCSSTFFFILTVYAFIVLAPFFLAKETDNFWRNESQYFEQPWINFRGDYIISCYIGSEQIFLTNIEQLSYLSDEKYQPHIQILKIDENNDNNFDQFEISIKLFVNSKMVKSCEIILNADYGLRKEILLQMQSPVQFSLKSSQGIKYAEIFGTLQLIQKNALLYTKIVRNVYNYTVPEQKNNPTKIGYYEYLIDYQQRNESVMSDYNSYIMPGIGQQIDLKFILQVPLFQKIKYSPPLIENLKFFWVQYICLFIPIYWLVLFLINFVITHKIFHTHIKTNLPTDLSKRIL